MKIPQIIHQTWKDYDVPEMFDHMASSWKERHPHWEYKFWTDEMNRKFIADHFTYFLPVYDSYEKPIQRVDAVRYFILYKYGGFFIDMDFECLTNIDPLINVGSCVFGKEPDEHCIIHNKEIIISNAFMGAVPGTDFMRFVCDGLNLPSSIIDSPNDLVLESTGPFLLSRLYSKYPRKEEICLLEPAQLYPLTKDELNAWNEQAIDSDTVSRLQQAYGIHHYIGTWWKK